MNIKPIKVTARPVSITEERGKDYGPVRDNFDRTAQMWQSILGCKVSAEQVGLCMIALKISRETFKHKDDNLIDIIGYTELLQQLNK